MRPKHIENLLSNWEKSDLTCTAELRYYDPKSKWECFIYAINPSDEDEMKCFITGIESTIEEWRFSEMAKLYNQEGESPILDINFRPRKLATILILKRDQ